MSIGETLPLWSVIPFVGMLLSIAFFPLFKPEWWEKHQLHVALAWSLIFLIPFTIGYGIECSAELLTETVLGDYVPFMILLLGLFAVSGGIHVSGTIVGTTKNNVIMLALGTVLSSFIGTTGSAMLLIRPIIRANHWRKHKTHIIVFFIFLVANIGGCLTPLGDPPLFLGFLRGVPFFWTFAHIWPLFLLNSILLLAVFALIDRHFIKKEGAEGEEREDLMEDATERTPLRIEGLHNLIFLAIIIFAVASSGLFSSADVALEEAGIPFSINVFGTRMGLNYFVKIGLILIATALSLKTTRPEIRERNDFEWGPITEVAKLFIGIFITMIPAIALLRANGGSLGIDTSVEFFWFTGALSSFLDNSPTYVVFLTVAGALGSASPDAVVTTVGAVAPELLLAISAGAVFMGAITYIGNAPNFMVKNMAEKANIKMPSFFGYMAWSLAILVPVFIIDTILFFL